MVQKPAGSAQILVVDDEPSLRQMLQVLLQRAGHTVSLATDVSSAKELLSGVPSPFDLVVTDLMMPDGSGLDVLDAARARSEETQVVIVTAHASVETAVDAMRRGAYAYLEKPLSVTAARAQFEKALEKRLLLRDNAALRAVARTSGVGDVLLASKNAAFQQQLELVRRGATSRVNVLITGESGTGKEVIAREVHSASDRASGPFVVVNCGAIPEPLLESELFGHEKGAFTGADRKREGLFRQADGGTLFLDEVGELPLSLQVKLLRVLQDRKVRAVGAATETPVDVRIVAATNRELESDVKNGRFRQDLFYRLNVLRVRVPPLRERREDLPLLIEHFRAKFSLERGRPFLQFSPDALRAMVGYEYPGNVRELENAIERAVALAVGATILLSDLPPELSGSKESVVPVLQIPEQGMNLEAYLEGIERSFLSQALERTQGVRTKAAALLGLSFRSFRYRLAKFGMGDDEEFEGERTSTVPAKTAAKREEK